jgi:hypothetical protein
MMETNEDLRFKRTKFFKKLFLNQNPNNSVDWRVFRCLIVFQVTLYRVFQVKLNNFDERLFLRREQ